MKHDVVISVDATQEMLEIADWYARRAQSRSVGDAWYAGISDVIQTLRHSPDRHPLARESHRFPFELRELHYGSGRRKTHRVLFRVAEQTVEVLSVRHAAQRDFTSEDL
jgi:plasmid stabilization system protein ParE